MQTCVQRYCAFASLFAVVVCSCSESDPATSERTSTPTTQPHVDQISAVLSDVLTNSEMEASRNFYGTPGDNVVALVGSNWPSGIKDMIAGWTVKPSDNGVHLKTSNRVLGLRLDKFSKNSPDADSEFEGFFNGPIQLTMFNAGGTANGAVIGGCNIWYAVQNVDGKWIAECRGLLDP
jgi:hypothetical protein